MPFVASLAIFLALYVIAFKFYLSLAPGLTAVTVLKVVLPFSFVGRTLRVDKGAVAVGHAVLPLTLVGVAVGLRHATLASHFIVLELPLVFGAVSPREHTEAFLNELLVDHDPSNLVWKFLTILRCISFKLPCHQDLRLESYS